MIEDNGLNAVHAVPPLPRRTDRHRTIDYGAAEDVIRHIETGGITRFLFGGNAFLYHATLAEYEGLLDWLSGFPVTRSPIPGVGPSFGRAMDQAALLKRHRFQIAMLLPCGDPRDAEGLEAGAREIANAAGLPLMLYVKSEDGFGSDRNAGLDAVGRLMTDGTATAIKYARARRSVR
jgi:dihydrodipicolinate synthase/N-acetylneuraminate lyase